MKTILSLFLSFFLLHLTSTFSVAQNEVIHGVVTTFDSIPLVGAEIIVKSSKKTFESDTLGRFAVDVENEDKLTFKAKGFYPQRVKLKGSEKLVAVNLKLKPTPQARAYAIGYGHVLDEEKLNSVANLNSDDMDFSQYSNLYEVIQGRFSGVQISNNGEIIIRGLNSIYAPPGALIILDGMPVEQGVLNNIPPVSVKSINIIKDGSAAIYGSRGANGVVIIETKRGNDNK